MRALAKTVVLCAMYLSVLMGLGLWHHHDTDGGLAAHAQCQACLWQANAIADEPMIFVLAVPSREAFGPLPTSQSPICAPRDLLPASRAPPAA